MRPALRELLTRTCERGGLGTEFDSDNWPIDVRTDADALLFSTARELLANVIKHAHARRVIITLSYAEDQARLVVADDGRGLPEAELSSRLAAGHIGLASRRARVEAVGGRFTIGAGPAGGTVVQVDVPARPLIATS